MSELELADVWPLTPLQEGLQFHALYDRQGPDVYTVQFVWELEGALDGEVLRGIGRGAAGPPRQPARGLPASCKSGRGPSRASRRRRRACPGGSSTCAARPRTRPRPRAERVAAEERGRRFDLAVPPLLRFVLIRLAPGRHHLVLTHHHILLDGWSMPLLARELFTIYTAGGHAARAPARTPYRDYLEWLSPPGPRGRRGRLGRSARRPDERNPRRTRTGRPRVRDAREKPSSTSEPS